MNDEPEPKPERYFVPTRDHKVLEASRSKEVAKQVLKQRIVAQASCAGGYMFFTNLRDYHDWNSERKHSRG